jgi:chromatin remodeling complex protein RSC6
MNITNRTMVDYIENDRIEERDVEMRVDKKLERIIGSERDIIMRSDNRASDFKIKPRDDVRETEEIGEKEMRDDKVRYDFDRKLMKTRHDGRRIVRSVSFF